MIRILFCKHFVPSNIHTLTTQNIDIAHTVTAIADEIALTLGGHNSPTKSQGTRFIPIPKEKMNPLVSITVIHRNHTLKYEYFA